MRHRKLFRVLASIAVLAGLAAGAALLSPPRLLVGAVTTFATPLDNTSSTLGAAYTPGSGSVTLAGGMGSTISTRLANAGFPAVSASAPLRFTITAATAINAAGRVDPSKQAVYLATGLTGDTLTGVTVEAGSTDQAFAIGDIWAIYPTARALYQLNGAVNAQEQGGGRVYDVTGYGVVGDCVQFTAQNVATTSTTIDVSGYAPTSADVGKTICVQASGSSSTNSLVTTVSAVTFQGATGSTTVSSGVVTLSGYTPVAGDVGKNIVVTLAGRDQTPIYDTIASVSGQTVTLTSSTASYAVTNAVVTIGAKITLAVAPGTSGGTVTATLGTDNYQALYNLLRFTVKPNATTSAFGLPTYYPNVFFPRGRYLVNMAGQANLAASGITISGQGPNSIIQLADVVSTSTYNYLFVNYSTLNLENIQFSVASNYDQYNAVCGVVQTGGSSGFGNGNLTILRNVTASGVMSTMVHAENDDSVEAYHCHFAGGQFILHSGVIPSAAVQMGRVRVIGGTIHDFGTGQSAGQNHLHGLYIAESVNLHVNGVRFYNQISGSTGFCIKFADDSQIGLSNSFVVDGVVCESTTVNGVIGAQASKALIVNSTFSCSAQPIRVQGDTDVVNCRFTGTVSTAILDLTVTQASTLQLINCDFYDNQLPVNLTTASKWNLIVKDTRFTQRTSANFATLTTPLSTSVVNSWFSDGTFKGRLPTASLTSGFAALAGPGAVWWDTTANVLKKSDGTNWYALLDSNTGQPIASNVTVNEGNWLLSPNAAGSASNGEFWQDSTQGTLNSKLKGITNRFVGCLYTQYSPITVTATGVTSLTSGSSSVGTLTLPANFFVVGKAVRLRASGYYSTSGTPGNVRVVAQLGSNNIGSPGSLTPPASQTNKPWSFEALIVCQSTGTTGSFPSTGRLTFSTATTDNVYGFFNYGNNTTAGTADTTASEAADVTVNWFSSGNSITNLMTTAEALN